MSVKPASVKSYWEKRIVRKMRNVTVSFYSRTPGSDLTMDFKVHGRRVQEKTGCFVMVDAERVALARITRLQEAVNGVEAAREAVVRERAPVATVADIRAALRPGAGAKVWEVRTAATYGASLVRLARMVDAVNPEMVRLDQVLRRDVIERFYAGGQGLKAVNWKDEIFDAAGDAVNGGLNTCIRNVKSLFGAESVRVKWEREAKLPDLTELRAAGYLHAPIHTFEPWENKVYAKMCEESEKLRERRPEMWLVNAMLRRLGLRVSELLAARRDWIETRDDEAWLVIKNRVPEFKLLKHGSARRLTLDAELRALLLPREGFLIGAGMKETARRELVEREHSAFLRQFIPDRRKSNHELRMYAASLVYLREREAGRDGLASAAYFLGDSLQTTKDYYAVWLGGSAMLDAEAVAAR